MFGLSSGIWKKGGSAIDACEEDKLTLRSQPPPICQTTPPYLLANEQLFGKFYSSFCPVAHLFIVIDILARYCCRFGPSTPEWPFLIFDLVVPSVVGIRLKVNRSV